MADIRPLTTNIRNLTAYANSVTGIPDTNLSDAVHTLADGYGQGGGSGGLSATTVSFSAENIFVGDHIDYIDGNGDHQSTTSLKAYDDPACSYQMLSNSILVLSQYSPTDPEMSGSCSYYSGLTLKSKHSIKPSPRTPDAVWILVFQVNAS